MSIRNSSRQLRASVTEATDTSGERSAVVQSNKEGLFSPYVSMKFNEVNHVTLVEKIVNLTKALKSLSEPFKRADPTVIISGLVFFFLGLLLDLITFLFRVYANPLKILVEARDVEGSVTYFTITDKRSCLARFLRCGVGQKMTLASLKHESIPILVTKTEAIGCPGVFCFCCCMCLWTSKFNLVDANDRRVMASHVLQECCSCKCKCHCTCCDGILCKPFIDVILCGEQNGKMKFYTPRCSCRLAGNVIGPSEKLPELYKLSVKRNKFSCKDFLLSSVDLFDELITDAAEDAAFDAAADVIGEKTTEAVKTGVEIAQNAKEAKDALDELKEKGYRKIHTTKSKWKVTFKPNQTNDQKMATVLYVIEQYAARL